MNPVDESIMRMVAQDAHGHLQQIQRAWRYYHGRAPKRLKVAAGQPDDNVVVGKPRTIVNKSVSYLFGKGVEFDLPEGTAEAAGQWLDEVWEHNGRDARLIELAMNGSVSGHAFLKLRLGTPYPEIIVLDPATVTPKHDMENVRKTLGYTIQYPAIDPDTGRPMTVRQLIEPDGESWLITDQRAYSGGAWQTVHTEPWPYPFAPVLDCQNLPCPTDFWGLSDLEEDILGLIDARNFGLSNWNRINKHFADPKMWGKKISAQEFRSGVGEIPLFQNSDAELHMMEAQSDQGSTRELDRRLDEEIHEASQTPPIATGKLESVGNLSGVAMQILFAPLLEKTRLKRVLYGTLLAETCRRLLIIGKHGDIRPTLSWPEMLPSDPMAERQALLLDQQMGVASKETISQKLGYDWESENQNMTEETDTTADQFVTQLDRGL